MTGAAIRLRREEQWQPKLPGRSLSATMLALAAASLAAHLALVAGAVLESRPPPPPPQEIAVEIVQDAAKPPAKPPEVAKREGAKAAAAEAAVAKLDTTPVKPEPAKAETATAAPPRHDVADEETKLAALQRELESLKTEQARLRSEQSAATAAPARASEPAMPRDAGLGPLPDSFQAVALPTSADGRGEATSYQEIVFSALAKAKGIGGTRGLPGSAGVRFSVDAAGNLVDIELVAKSGVAALDAEALDIVHRAAPFPPPPQGAQRSFDANFTFRTQAER